MLPEFLGATWDGARAAIGEPLALLTALAAALAALSSLATAPRRGRFLLSLTMFLVAALGTRWVAPSPMHATVAAVTLVLLGALCASGWRLQGRVHLVAAVLGGVGIGLSAGLPVSIGTEAVGTLLLGAALYASASAVGVQLQRRWPQHVAMQLAPRILGAWATAIGLLLMALHLWGRSA
jgi:hypothetical protein